MRSVHAASLAYSDLLCVFLFLLFLVFIISFSFFLFLCLLGGTADDNVHFQNSALLVDALIDFDLPLSLFYFPNRAHSLNHWINPQQPCSQVAVVSPRILYQMITRILTGQGGPDGTQP